MKTAAYVGMLLGLAVLVVLMLRSDLAGMLHALHSAGWQLMWLPPWRLLFFLLYALGWLLLLRPYDPERRARLGYVLWVTTVREAIDRLLPVASIGGGFAAVRLMRWRGLAGAPVAATVIVEVVLTVIVLYVFSVIGVALLGGLGAAGNGAERSLLLVLVFSLPAPMMPMLLLRYGSVFGRLARLAKPLMHGATLSDDAVALDHELRATLARSWTLLSAGALQLAALLSASFEVWLVLRLVGHPVDARGAVMLESLTQAVRHLAFVVPAGLGVQEAGFVLFGQALGLSAEVALAVSMAKRLREVVCGVPALISWQLMEGRRL